MSIADAKRVRKELAQQGRLNSDGRTVSLYHVTDDDSAKSIAQQGLIPGHHAAPGQTWKAKHSDYATYFLLDKEVALDQSLQAGEGWSFLEVKIPITPKSIIRIIPDEDSERDVTKGLNVLLSGGSVAYIGGVPASAIVPHFVKHPVTEGGSGSGNFGHAGRPGEVGGSAPSGAGGRTVDAGGGQILDKKAKRTAQLPNDYRSKVKATSKARNLQKCVEIINKDLNVCPAEDVEGLENVWVEDKASWISRTSTREEGERPFVLATYDQTYRTINLPDHIRANHHTVVHEIGHHVWHQKLPTEIKKEFIRIFHAAKGKAFSAGGGFARITPIKVKWPSEYAKHNVHEFFAETYRDYHLGRRIDKNLKELLDSYYKKTESITEGSASSGNYGHAGRPGQVGGSATSGAGGGTVDAGGGERGTLARYTDAKGNLTPERLALHDKIRQKVFKDKTPVDHPTAYLIGGGPASGKSTMVQSGGFAFPENTVVIDPDAFKTELPEFQEGVKNKDPNAAEVVHEETSLLSKQLAREAGEGGYNVLLDGTGDGNIVGLEKKVSSMRAGGQRVVGIYATAPVEGAIARSLARAQRTGRYVPESVIRETHKGVSRVLPEAIRRGLFDEFTVWDTRVSPAVKIASGAKDKLTIHHAAWWKEFLAKGED